MSAVEKLVEKKLLLGGLCGIAILTLLFFLLGGDNDAVDPLVGDGMWTQSTKRETTLGTYRIWQSADFKGGDLAFTPVASIELCLYACDDQPDCSYVSYDDGICYLKNLPTIFETPESRPRLFAAKRVKTKQLLNAKWHDGEVFSTGQTTFRTWTASTCAVSDSATNTQQATAESCWRECEQQGSSCLTAVFDGLNCKLDGVVAVPKDLLGSWCAVKATVNDAPDGLVKGHWTKGGPRETKEHVYQTWSSCSFSGPDLAIVSAATLDACLDECDNELFCYHVTLAGNECFLKAFDVHKFSILPDRSDVWAAKRVSTKIKHDRMLVGSSGLNDKAELSLRHDSLIGKFFDESRGFETKFNRYRTWTGFDFWGGDISDQSVVLSEYTEESCMGACDETAECRFAVVTLGKDCWLKSHPYEMERTVDENSGVVAVMKVGRVGKKGLMEFTTEKHDSRTVRGQGKSESSFGGAETTAEGSGLFSFPVVVGGVVVAVLLAVVLVKQHENRFDL